MIHKIADELLINVIDCVGENIRSRGFRRVALLDTKFTMGMDSIRTGSEMNIPSRRSSLISMR